MVIETKIERQTNWYMEWEESVYRSKLYITIKELLRGGINFHFTQKIQKFTTPEIITHHLLRTK